ncbi:MAG: aspartate aminotransferase family protein [Rhodospirillales bacterium]
MIDAVMPTYARLDVAFERGEGAYLFDEAGNRYLDFAAGIAVDSLGHCHPHLVAALTEQAGKLWHVSNLYQIPGQKRLAERLVANTFADSVFFTNSGAEALECSFKMARRYQSQNGHPERYRVICCTGAFHGRTLATIAAGGQAKHLDGFGPVVDGFDHVAFDNMNEMRDAITPETAAILVEPVQGEGGIRPVSAAYLKAMRQACDEFGLLLILDEVQSGMGRTGKLFAHEWSGVSPDIMASAKGLGGGFPVGACLATEKAASALTAGTHGSTFGGNPLAMSAANAVLDVILKDGFLDHVVAVGNYLKERLDAVATANPKVIEEVRGKGLMLGLKCAGEGTNLALNKQLFAHHMLSVPAGDNVVRLIPPLVIDESHVDEAVSIIETAAAAVHAEAA